MLNKIDQLTPQLRLKPWRAMMLFGFLILGLIGLIARAVFLQGVNNDFLQKEGAARYSKVVEMSADRGMIKDRNGEILAISAPVASVYADPKLIEITPGQLEQLARL